MHILIAEKNFYGRRVLSRILKMEGYEISVAESGSHALNLLAEKRPDIVLMNVFQCLHAPDETPSGNIKACHYDSDSTPTLLVTCSRGGENLGEFMSPNNQYCDAAFDLLPTAVKICIMERIQQMCRALKRSKNWLTPGDSFNWQHFNRLMGWNPTLGM